MRMTTAHHTEIDVDRLPALAHLYREHVVSENRRREAETRHREVAATILTLAQRHFTEIDGYAVVSRDSDRDRDRTITIRRGRFTARVKWWLEPLRLNNPRQHGTMVILDADPEVGVGIARVREECDRLLRFMTGSGTFFGGIGLILLTNLLTIYDPFLIPVVFTVALIGSYLLASRLCTWIARNRLEPYVYDEQLVEIQAHWTAFIAELELADGVVMGDGEWGMVNPGELMEGDGREG